MAEQKETHRTVEVLLCRYQGTNSYENVYLASSLQYVSELVPVSKPVTVTFEYLTEEEIVAGAIKALDIEAEKIKAEASKKLQALAETKQSLLAISYQATEPAEPAKQAEPDHSQAPLKNFYLTFGQIYRDDPHPSGMPVDPDGYVRITAPTMEDARSLAFNIYGEAWAFLYDEHNFEFSSFPAGEFDLIEWS